MNVQLTQKEEHAKEKAMESACGRETPEQSPTEEERKER